ncbi:MAG: response regulator [Holophagales bacterium]|nr:response regulator [Holophagales bacterium]
MRISNIRVQLRITFLVMMLFCFLPSFGGLFGLFQIQQNENVTIDNVETLKNVRATNVSLHSTINSLVTQNDFNLTPELETVLNEQITALNNSVEIYYSRQDQFASIFTPGERQDMLNLKIIFENLYIKNIRIIIDALKSGKLAAAINSLEDFNLAYSTVIYISDFAIDKNITNSRENAVKNHRIANLTFTVVLGIAALAVVASWMLLNFTSKSITSPLEELGRAANGLAKSNLGEQTMPSAFQNPDDIAQFSKNVLRAIDQVAEVQKAKEEAMVAKYEKEKAEASVRAKSDFLAKMSHEIRTPMNAITGMAELAMRENLPSAAREYVLTIKQAGADLLSIINDILDFSKIETGKLEIINRKYSFSSLVNDVISIIRMRAFESNIKFIVKIDSRIPNELIGDQIRLRQVLINLLSNAFKYTERGSVTFTIIGKIIGDETVDLTVGVKDTGRGIHKDNLSKIFDSFIQVDADKNKYIEGTGLGLPISKSLAIAMGGDITVESQYGMGSTFTLTISQAINKPDRLATVQDYREKHTLVYEADEQYADSVAYALRSLQVPCTLVSSKRQLKEKLDSRDYPFIFIASDAYEDIRGIIPPPDTGSHLVLMSRFGEVVAEDNLQTLSMPLHSISVANVLNGKAAGSAYKEDAGSLASFTAPRATVLIVDDVSTNLHVAKGLLALYEITVDLAKSGAEAIQAIVSKKYDLILMDHMMPGMNGVEATARIRGMGSETPYYSNLPIVALTANAVIGAKDMFLKNGFNDFLSKPIEMAKLDIILSRWIPQEKQKKTLLKTKHRRSSAVIEIEGIDTRIGVARVGGEPNKYLQTLGIFLQDGKEKSAEIKKALNADDISMYVICVHALKSALTNIGALNLSMTAKNLENAGRINDLQYIQSQNGTFISDLETMLVNIAKALDAHSNKSNGAVAAVAEIKSELAMLKAAIDNLDPAAIKEAVKKLQPFVESEGVGNTVREMLMHILVGEYDEAAGLIDVVIKKIDAGGGKKIGSGASNGNGKQMPLALDEPSDEGA